MFLKNTTFSVSKTSFHFFFYIKIYRLNRLILNMFAILPILSSFQRFAFHFSLRRVSIYTTKTLEQHPSSSCWHYSIQTADFFWWDYIKQCRLHQPHGALAQTIEAFMDPLKIPLAQSNINIQFSWFLNIAQSRL